MSYFVISFQKNMFRKQTRTKAASFGRVQKQGYKVPQPIFKIYYQNQDSYICCKMESINILQRQLSFISHYRKDIHSRCLIMHPTLKKDHSLEINNNKKNIYGQLHLLNRILISNILKKYYPGKVKTQTRQHLWWQTYCVLEQPLSFNQLFFFSFQLTLHHRFCKHYCHLLIYLVSVPLLKNFFKCSFP